MKLDTLTVEDASLRCWSGGSGPPLLYLHGIEGHPGEASFLARLGESHTVYAPEMPGYGQSNGFEKIDDILDLTLFYRSLIERLDIGEADVVGHSLGGMIAAEVAALNPHLVRRLVLVAPFGLWLDDHQIPDIFGLGDSALKAALWHNPEAMPAAQSTNGMSPIDIIIRKTEDMAVAAKFLWPIPDRGLLKRLPYIKAPTFVITGGGDGIIPPAYGGAFAQAIPNATSITITDAGHYPMVEQEALFIDEVTRFLGA